MGGGTGWLELRVFGWQPFNCCCFGTSAARWL